MVVKLLNFAIIANLVMAETVRFGGELFLDGQDARNAGMGGYSVSLTSGRNPALLFQAQESSVHFSPYFTLAREVTIPLTPICLISSSFEGS